MNTETKNNEFSELAQSYLINGYYSHYNHIDAETVAAYPCTECGSQMRYIGLQKDTGERMSYIAIAHCDNCSNEHEF